MKRKLSALLAIVLAVVMVFPTAVFVGADDPAPENPKIEKFEVGVADMNGKKLSATDIISIPVDGYVDITVATDVGTDVKFELSDDAIATATQITNGYRFTGRYADNSGTVKITVTKKGAEGTTPAVKEATINVACHTPEITLDRYDAPMIKVTYEGHNDGDDSSLDPGDIAKNAKVEITLDNGKSFSDANAKINTENKFSDKLADYSSVKVKGGESTLYFKYEIETPYKTYTGVVEKKIYVLGKAISDIVITPVSYKSFLYTDRGVDSDDIIVTAYYTDNGTDVLTDYVLHGIYNATSADAAISMAKKDERKAVDFTDMLRDEEIYIVVEYDGVFAAMNANELDFSNPVPYKVEVAELLPSAKTEYIDGQVFGQFGFNGVKIRIYYEGMDNGEERVAGGYIEYVHDKGIPEQDIPGVEDIRGVLEFDPFVYGDNKVEFTYTENGTEIDGEFFCSDLGITIEKKQVTKLEIANTSGVKTKYQAGEKLNLDNLTLKVTFNSLETEEISYANPNVTYNPKHGTELTTDIDSVLFTYTYTDPETKLENSVKASLPITVTAAKAESTIKEVILVADGTKTEYFIGESFEKDGYRLFVTYNDNTPSKYVNLSDCLNFSITDAAKYKNGEFIKAFSGSLTINFKLPTSIDKDSKLRSLILEDITVTKRPVLQSIVATSSKDTYMVGDAPEVQEITITAKYDDNSTRVFKIADDTTDANKVKTTYTITTGGVTYTMKLTPTKIDEDTTDIRVTYTEKITGGTTTTKYYDIEIEVIVPEAILSYYDGGWKYEPYMDFDEALEAAEEYANTLSSSYLQSRKPSIQLCKDITVLYDYSVTEYMEIDLNGFDLTMVPGEIFVKSTSSAELTFVNNGNEDSMIIYSKTNDDDNIIIGEDDSYVIDADSGDGKYEITITKPTNGKVTGPQEVTHGHDVKFTITPDEDYEVKTITVKEGKSNKKYENKDNVVTVEDVQGELTITVTFQEKAWENPFTDVYKSATYYKSIQFVYENGLFSGMSATKFEPDTTMTRAMFVTVLGRLAGIDAEAAAARYGNTSSFSDVSASDASISYAVPYIKWATDNGLIEGYGNGKFGPKDNITHIQMYVLMQRYAAFIERLNTSATGTNIPANDVKDIPTWDGAYEAVEYAAKQQFLVTSSNRLTPNGNAKRSELAVLLEKFCTNVLDWDN